MPTTGDAPVPRGPSRVEAVELVFVYNAPDGVIAALGDMIHKIVSPSTYPCSLCAVTYGAFTMRPAWRAYLRTLPCPARFYHRDGFRRDWPAIDAALPAVFLRRAGTLRLLLDRATLDAQRDVDQLIVTLNAALARAFA